MVAAGAPPPPAASRCAEDAADQLDRPAAPRASVAKRCSGGGGSSSRRAGGQPAAVADEDEDFAAFVRRASKTEAPPGPGRAEAVAASPAAVGRPGQPAAGANEAGDGGDASDDGEAGPRSAHRYVTPKDFELLKVVGMGSFGKVLQVKNRRTGTVHAMKIISKRLLRRKAGYVGNILAEQSIMARVRHPFVVAMHCSFQTKEKLFLIMDFLAGGTRQDGWQYDASVRHSS
jgi:hypothetical protein